jgi:hypothetical protein
MCPSGIKYQLLALVSCSLSWFGYTTNSTPRGNVRNRSPTTGSTPLPIQGDVDSYVYTFVILRDLDNKETSTPYVLCIIFVLFHQSFNIVITNWQSFWHSAV